MRVCDAPSARAASTNSFSRSEKNWARTSRATGIQRKPPITATISMNTPPSGPSTLFRRVAEEIDDQQQQWQLRQRKEQVGEPHQRGVDTAARACRRSRRPARRRRSPSSSRPGPRRARCGRRRACARAGPGRGRRCRADAATTVPCSWALKSISLIGSFHSQRTENDQRDQRHQHEQARVRHPVAPEAPPAPRATARAPRRARLDRASGRRCEGRASHRAGRRSG